VGVFAAALLPLVVAAHDVATELITPSVDELVGRWMLRVVLGAAVVLGLLVAAGAAATHSFAERAKQVVFCSIVAVVSLVTLAIAATTLTVNVASESGGPVHWHADFHIVACGTELDVVDPRGLSNKVGTPVLHEHDDNRIHIEGVLYRLADGSLGRFFHVIGGYLGDDRLVVPTNDGRRSFANGDRCRDGTVGEVQVFAYQVDAAGVARQSKLTHPADYVPGPYQRVPPGDCLIIEFGPARERTDRTCTFYDIAAHKGELRYAD
jgi:hypothetical protein